VGVNADLAKEVRDNDDVVDEMHRENFEKIKACMRERPEEIDALMHILSISRRLERIADHATNISEDVIYLIKGEIVRHGSDMEEQTKKND
jgi:phosphate transport system protein